MKPRPILLVAGVVCLAANLALAIFLRGTLSIVLLAFVAICFGVQIGITWSVAGAERAAERRGEERFRKAVLEEVQRRIAGVRDESELRALEHAAEAAKGRGGDG